MADNTDAISLDNVEHRKHGIWDIYEHTGAKPKWYSLSPALRSRDELRQDFAQIWIAFKAIMKMRSGIKYTGGLAAANFALSLLPVLFSWLNQKEMSAISAQTSTAIGARRFYLLFAGRVVLQLIQRILEYIQRNAFKDVQTQAIGEDSIRAFRTLSRLDYPTFTDEAIHDVVYRSARSVSSKPRIWGHSTPTELVTSVLTTAQTALTMISEALMFMRTVRGQPNGALIGVTVLIPRLKQFLFEHWTSEDKKSNLVTTTEAAYLRLKGIVTAISSSSYRKEIVAGNRVY